VPGTLQSLFRGERPVIRSDGQYVRDYLYVKDAASAYLALADALHDGRMAGEAVNFSGDARRAVLEIVDDLQRLTGITALVPDIRNTATAEIREQWLSSEKARRLLGWTPAFSLEQGLAETVGWYRRWFATWDGRATRVGSA
jgi:CDP-glucose 4,6-dehydratase